MSFDVTDSEISALTVQANAGAAAKNFRDCESCGGMRWLEEIVLKAMDEKALKILKAAKGRAEDADADRMKAQMYAHAADEVRDVVNALISSGDAAREILKQVSTPKEGENNG